MNRLFSIPVVTVFVTGLSVSCAKEDPATAITYLSLYPTRLTMEVTETYTLNVSKTPQYPTDETIVWSSSDTTIAKVSETGLVTGVGHGFATIKVETPDGSVSATSTVNIIKWISYTSASSGLVNDTIYCISFDTQGNNWFGTCNGVSRFDGSDWTTFNSSNSGLSHNWVFSTATDKEGNSWFGDEYGLSKFNGTTWTSFTTGNSGLVSWPVNAIAFDSDGNAWIGTANGVSRFDGADWTTYTTSNSNLVNDMIGTISIDSKENIWFGTGSGISEFTGTNWNTYNEYLPGPPNSIAEDAEGNLWIGTSDGLSKFNGSTFTTYFHGTQVNAVAFDSNGYLWVARTYEYDNNYERVSGGVSRFDGEHWKTFDIANSDLINNTVISIGIDPDGNKWFGTLAGVTQLQD